MSLSRKDVEHIANLARIDLTDGEKSAFEIEISAILLFVETLNELDTEGIEPVNGGTLLANVMRGDEQEDIYMEKKSVLLIEAARERKGNLVKVKAVFE